MIGVVATFISAIIFAYSFRRFDVALGLVTFFAIVLLCTLMRNHYHLQDLQKALILNMAIVTYIEN